MNELRFTVDIRAPKERVWDCLWRDETLRDWASIIDPGTYMVGPLTEGAEVQFISSENGYGVTSLVEKLVPNEYALLRHHADTQQRGEQVREKQWTDGTERYTLSETDGITTLATSVDVPQELEDYFNVAYPKALARVKELAEKK